MRAFALAALSAAAIAITACGTNDTTTATASAGTDDELAAEISREVYGRELADAKAGEDAARAAAVEAAETNCRVMRAQLSTNPGEANTAALTSLVTELRSTGLSREQALRMIRISADYKCPEFIGTVRVFEASS
ncbi:hypothetical protein [Nocardia puris]|uniref:DUF732 domain-containing protein n=1 Tax=Nocardia puris TaxID=208602 RepID=A0A366DCM8_9NOCA|nr:hypothetical protein [Nocardia puris]RBO87008.1 hypothetical protein DFR74_112185 [Nocardia puris]